MIQIIEVFLFFSESHAQNYKMILPVELQHHCHSLKISWISTPTLSLHLRCPSSVPKPTCYLSVSTNTDLSFLFPQHTPILKSRDLMSWATLISSCVSLKTDMLVGGEITGRLEEAITEYANSETQIALENSVIWPSQPPQGNGKRIIRNKLHSNASVRSSPSSSPHR